LLPIINPPFHFLPILSMSNDTKHSRPVTVSAEALEFTSLTNKSEIVYISDVSELDAISYCLGASPYFLSTSSHSPPPVSLAALQLKDDRGPTVSKVGLIPVMWKNRTSISDKKGTKFAVFNGLGSGLFLSTAKERARMRLKDENSGKVNNPLMSLSRKFSKVGSMRVKFADLDG